VQEVMLDWGLIGWVKRNNNNKYRIIGWKYDVKSL
jgi:hypothetical protein